MSYEGYVEFICSNGHYMTLDAYDHLPRECSKCGSTSAHYHDVVQTNGIEEDNPSTFSSPKEEDGFEDEWHIDHYDNKYATKILKYRPIGPYWVKVDLDKM